MSVLRILWNYRSSLIVILTPLILLPLPLVLRSTEASSGYCIILMATYWITDVLPLAVTAFLPLILFPMMGIMPASDVSMVYMKDTNWLFIGGLMIAVGVEHTRLHKRIALRVLLSVGSKPHGLMLGFMIPTYFLSMWISNTATTAMMIPIAEAIIQELVSEEETLKDEHSKLSMENTSGELSSSDDILYTGTGFYVNNEATAGDVINEDEKRLEIQECKKLEVETNKNSDDNTSNQENNDTKKVELAISPQQQKIAKGLTVCVPYSASIGGITTLTGTGPNLVLAGQYPALFPDSDITLSFGIWFVYHLPISLLLLILSYIWLVWLYLDFNFQTLKGICSRSQQTEKDKKIEKLLKDQYRELGDIRWAEVTVLVVFTITALLWFFREPGFMPGWSVIFKEDYVSDGTVAITMAVLLFFLPSERPRFLGERPEDSTDIKPVPPVLDWPTVHRMFPWSIIFLLGGGYALAEGATVSGFSQWLAEQLEVLGGIPDWAICLVITIITCLFTECTSNVATASLFIPIIAQLAVSVQVHPLYLLLPAVVATSLAFMLPVATPPNAIAFSYGRLKVIDLVKAGWMLNLVGILVLMVFINTYGVFLFGLDEFPDWASDNTTATTSTATILVQ